MACAEKENPGPWSPCSKTPSSSPKHIPGPLATETLWQKLNPVSPACILENLGEDNLQGILVRLVGSLESRLRWVHGVNKPVHPFTLLKDHPHGQRKSIPGQHSRQGWGGNWYRSKTVQLSPNPLSKGAENQALQKKSLKKSVYMVLVPSTAPTIHLLRAPSPEGCVIPSYSLRTREEIPLFEHTSASVPQPWSSPPEACPHFAPDHKAFALHLAGTTSLVFE